MAIPRFRTPAGRSEREILPEVARPMYWERLFWTSERMAFSSAVWASERAWAAWAAASRAIAAVNFIARE